MSAGNVSLLYLPVRVGVFKLVLWLPSARLVWVVLDKPELPTGNAELCVGSPGKAVYFAVLPTLLSKRCEGGRSEPVLGCFGTRVGLDASESGESRLVDAFLVLTPGGTPLLPPWENTLSSEVQPWVIGQGTLSACTTLRCDGVLDRLRTAGWPATQAWLLGRRERCRWPKELLKSAR